MLFSCNLGNLYNKVNSFPIKWCSKQFLSFDHWTHPYENFLKLLSGSQEDQPVSLEDVVTDLSRSGFLKCMHRTTFSSSDETFSITKYLEIQVVHSVGPTWLVKKDKQGRRLEDPEL